METDLGILTGTDGCARLTKYVKAGRDDVVNVRVEIFIEISFGNADANAGQWSVDFMFIVDCEVRATGCIRSGNLC